MKTSTLLKSLSAVGILGTAVFSINANAEGGCPAGSVPQQGQGWQTCVPIPNYGGGSTPSRSNGEVDGSWAYHQTRPLTAEEQQKLDTVPLVVYWVDKKTNEVGYKEATNGNVGVVAQQFQTQCARNNRDCEITSFGITKPHAKVCGTFYKYPYYTSQGGLFSKRKFVMKYNVLGWDSQADKVNRVYPQIKAEKGTPFKDITDCLN